MKEYKSTEGTNNGKMPICQEPKLYNLLQIEPTKENRTQKSSQWKSFRHPSRESLLHRSRNIESGTHHQNKPENHPKPGMSHSLRQRRYP
jgi:hypothetical protein